MNCNNAKELLLSYLDNELNPLEIVSIEDHLSDCPICRAELEALAETKRALCQAFETTAARVSPSPQAWENIKYQLTKENQRNGSVLSPTKSIMKGLTGILKQPRPVWQTLGALGVAVLIVLSITLPSSPINLPVTIPPSSPDTPVTIPPSSPNTPVADEQMTKFSSYDELKEFAGEGTRSYSVVYPSNIPLLSVVSADAYVRVEGVDSNRGSESLSEPFVVDVNSGSEDYSTTNIQVRGVDEADIIKTDGEFIYLASDSRVIIAKAYPTDEAQVLAEIDQDKSIDGLFINGDRLVVIYQKDLFISESSEESAEESSILDDEVYIVAPQAYIPQTYVKVYDVSDKSNPVLTRDMSIDGDYFGSRMIGDHIYVIADEWAYEQDDEIRLPSIQLDGNDIKINATDIYNTDIADDFYSFTTIAGVNVKEDEQEPEYKTILRGDTSNLYVSLNNIYVTSTVSSENSKKTAIHRIRISDGDIEYEARGEVPGRLLDQFSMDEYQGFFRVATTNTSWDLVSTGGNGSDVSSSITLYEENIANHVYILDMDLNTIGKVEDLAPGEQIYSARFMGKKAYVVTFRQVDPLFVIDMTDPYDPEVLGQLKITGYSDYLHPYDENHLIGIGKEATTTGLFQGVKISLFDVSDVSNPKEIAKYIIGDRGTESPVLDDHKALLFDRSRNLLVLPVLVSEGSYYYTWQGAYVFDISIEDGLQLKGRITHYDNPDQAASSYYSYRGAETIQRSLYIEDVLYTLSEAKIGMNDLESLDEIGEIILP